MEREVSYVPLPEGQRGQCSTRRPPQLLMGYRKMALKRKGGGGIERCFLLLSLILLSLLLPSLLLLPLPLLLLLLLLFSLLLLLLMLLMLLILMLLVLLVLFILPPLSPPLRRSWYKHRLLISLSLSAPALAIPALPLLGGGSRLSRKRGDRSRKCLCDSVSDPCYVCMCSCGEAIAWLFMQLCVSVYVFVCVYVSGSIAYGGKTALRRSPLCCCQTPC